MKKLRELSLSIEHIYKEMGLIFSTKQQEAKLNCLPQCGACCLNPDVEASPLEMLPLALDLYDRGLAIQTLEELEGLALERPCHFYQKTSSDGQKGFCTVYDKRPSLCRVFGAAARLNKQGQSELSVCRAIKQAHPEAYEQAKMLAHTFPLMSLWKSKVRNLSFVLPIVDMPINQALKEALEKVLFCASFNPEDNPIDKVS